MQGLAALLVQGLSGCKPEEVAHLTPDWITRIGLQQSLTPSRNNGFLNMFGLMRHKAAQLLDGQVQTFIGLHGSAMLPLIYMMLIFKVQCCANQQEKNLSRS